LSRPLTTDHRPLTTPTLGRYEFAIRRLHSLTGLMPIGFYLIFHLATNAAVIDGPEAYQHRADQIHVLGPTTIFFLEWPLIFLPILFHGLIGLLIVTRGKRNLLHYPYRENFRYTLQRWTGVIAFAFILWHVSVMHGWFHFDWWVKHVAHPLGWGQFDPTNNQAPATAATVIQRSPIVGILYAIGVLASVYHLANGLWTMGITWGVWTSPRAQVRANYLAVGVGVFLAVIGLGALWGMERVHVPRHGGETIVERGPATDDSPLPLRERG
jgi:succinate dehydrogenase / fumarate reductase, cytochrome b subunit